MIRGEEERAQRPEERTGGRARRTAGEAPRPPAGARPGEHGGHPPPRAGDPPALDPGASGGAQTPGQAAETAREADLAQEPREACAQPPLSPGVGAGPVASGRRPRSPARSRLARVARGGRPQRAPDEPPGHLQVDEPILAARVHRPADLLRALLGLLGIGLVLALATWAIGTTEGIERDVDAGAEQAPSLLISLAGAVSSAAVLVVPVAFAVERLVKRDGLRIADGVLAAVLAHGVSLSFSLWVARLSPDSVQNALTRQAPGGHLTDPVHGYLAPVIAYATAVGMTHRPRWRLTMWSVLLVDGFAALFAGYTTPFAIVVTVLIGWTISYTTLYLVGTPNVRPTANQLLAGLRRAGFRPLGARRAEDPAEAERRERRERRDHSEPTRRYLVTMADGPALDVILVDRAQQAHGFFYRVWRQFALRGIAQRRSLPSLRQTLEQEALFAYAARAAGANVPRLVATAELGPDAVMLAYEHVGGQNLDALPDDRISDELMRTAWEQVRALQTRRIAHRRLDGSSLLVDPRGQVYLTELRAGEIAAGDLPLRMDVAQLVVTFGLRVGAERAVAAAVQVLGPDAVADSLPLLQPIALSRATRATLRQLARERAQRERQAVLDATRAYREARGSLPENADRKTVKAARQAEKQVMEEALERAKEPDLLSQIRQEVLLIRPQAPIEPARIERISPRNLISIIAAVFAGYFLTIQLINPEFKRVWEGANWGWVIVAAGFSTLTYFAAALSLLGFVPEKVAFRRTVLAQVAGSFVKIVAPSAIGGVALNTRYLQRQGLRPGHAVASVGASQLLSFGSYIVLLLSFGYLTGTEHTPSLSPSRTVIGGLLTVAVAVLIVTAVPRLRKTVSERIRTLFAGVVPRMLDVVQQPRKLLSGIGGMLLMTLAFVMCLDASLRAFGWELSYPTIAVVFLAGNALGSAAPTPGGIGAVELTLSAGLAAFGVPDHAALGAVLLFRLMTLWLPVLPGWLAFTHLTRRGDI